MGKEFDWSRAKVRSLEAGDIERKLVSLERAYGMSSEDFYAKYNRGELSEKADFVRWASYCEMAARAGLVRSKAGR